MYNGCSQNSRVSIIVNQKCKNRITSYTAVNDRIIVVKFKIIEGVFVLLVYMLQRMVWKKCPIYFMMSYRSNYNHIYNNTYHVVIAGGLNDRVSNQTIKNVIRLLGEPSINRNEIRLKVFANVK